MAYFFFFFLVLLGTATTIGWASTAASMHLHQRNPKQEACLPVVASKVVVERKMGKANGKSRCLCPHKRQQAIALQARENYLAWKHKQEHHLQIKILSS